MATNGVLKFQGTNKATFVGATSNVVIDTVKSSFGVGVDVDGPTSNLHVVGNAYVSTELTVGGTVTATAFAGDGSGLTGISTSPTLQSVTDTGNVTSNTIQFTNATTGFVTTSNIGIGTTDPNQGKVDILTEVNSTGLNIRSNDYGQNNGASSIRIGAGGGAGASHHAMITGGHTTNGSSYLSFSTIFDAATDGYAPVERVRIDNIGKIISMTKSASGGTVSTVGSDNLHQFTTSGVFNVTGADITVQFLIIGGGGGGARNHGGAGGAGQYISRTTMTLPRGVYPITIGTGGDGGDGNNPHGENGGDTYALGYIAKGGGGGGSRNEWALFTRQKALEGWDGGSGGGGAGTAVISSDTLTFFGQGANTLGYGNVDGNATNPGGYGGGKGTSGADSTNAGNGGGGGGAGGAGGDATGAAASGQGVSGNGGAPLSSSITGTSVARAGGGSGGRWASGSVGTVSGGGGVGGNADGVLGTNGTNGTGGGGGGGGGANGDGGDGGDGIVIIRWTP